MQVKSLRLQQFRNIDSVTFQFDERLNVFIGNNGQGKTNIIEALVYLSFGQSFRVSDDKLLIQNNQDFAKVESMSSDGLELSVVISKTGKYILRNGAVLKRLSDLIGLMNVIVFHPDDLNFFAQAPRLRRREIDYELGKYHHESLDYLNQYRKLLALRNAALKADQIDPDYISIIDEKMITLSIPLIKLRHTFVKQLEKRITPLFKQLTKSDLDITFEYKTHVDPNEALEDQLRESYQSSYNRDLAFKSSHVGIHRDDYIFKMNGQAVVETASQGQRRLLMLAYKFALVNLFIETKGIVPILCLDDLFSELDQEKRDTLFQYIPSQVQVFVSTTDLAFLASNLRGKVFTIENGFVIKEAQL